MCFLCYSCFFTFRFFFSHHLLSLVHQGEILTNNKNIPVINIFFLKLAVFIERKNASCLFNLSGYRQKKCLFGSHLNAYLMFLDPRLHLFFILLYIYISINIYFYVYMCTD